MLGTTVIPAFRLLAQDENGAEDDVCSCVFSYTRILAVPRIAAFLSPWVGRSSSSTRRRPIELRHPCPPTPPWLNKCHRPFLEIAQQQLRRLMLGLGDSDSDNDAALRGRAAKTPVDAILKKLCNAGHILDGSSRSSSLSSTVSLAVAVGN